MLASCYLLFRRANAIAPDVTPPVRLRRWTAAFFAVFVVNHLWYLGPTFFLTSDDDVKLTNMIGILLDSMTFFPLSIIVLLVMLQDRRRPLWPVAVMVAPLISFSTTKWLFTVDEHLLNNIYGSRVATIWSLVAR